MQQPSATILSPISSSSSNKLPDIDELYSISQGGTTTQNNHGIEVSASQIPSTADKITTRLSRGVQPKKSTAQLTFESQERFDRAEKAAKKAQRGAAILKKQAIIATETRGITAVGRFFGA